MSNLFLQLAQTIMETGSIILGDSAAMLLQNEILKEKYPGE
jgi:hypothetical protein